MSSVQPLLDAAGRHRSPATTPGFRAGIAPRNKGQRYPADPPTVDEIVAVMRQAGRDRHGHRVNGLIVVLWRAGLRINEALSLVETDLDQQRGSVLVRHGKNDRRREVGMDAWAWAAIAPWVADRLPAAGRATVLRDRRPDPRPGVVSQRRPRRAAPPRAQSRGQAPVRPPPAAPRAAVELLHEGIPLPLIQRQLGHSPCQPPAPTSKGSTPRKSSPPSTPGAHR